MNEQDRIRILNMVKNGVITVEEAEKLLRAGESASEPQAARPQPAKPTEEIALKDTRGRKGKKFRIVVDSQSDKSKSAKVNVTIPLSLIRTLGPVIIKNLPGETKDEISRSGVDIMQIMSEIENLIDTGLEDDIVNVDTEEGDKVRIYVE